MIIRKAETKDLESILKVLDTAKAFMESTGNHSQWNGMDYPGNSVPGDIEKRNGYVVENDGKVCGYFALIQGEDPCYKKIEGKWLDDELPYAAIHRVASDGSCHGLIEKILDYGFGVINNIRIDTHEDNGPMRHKLDKNGFTYCGTVWMADGTPRRAYQKIETSLSFKEKLNNARGHFKTITAHRHEVMRLCIKAGLVRQGLLHDLSKYTPIEFSTGVRFYQGTRSPNAIEKNKYGHSKAWLHHKGRNRHHFEYWLDVSYDSSRCVAGAKMPMKYVIEMACDRIAACKTYHGASYTDADPLKYWFDKYEHVAPAVHPETRRLLEKILTKLKDEGEEACIEYMKWLLKHPEEY